MIFVTVGTHEQPFDRLVEYMDIWAKEHDEEVIIQRGYSNYVPKFAQSEMFYSAEEIGIFMDRATVIITHGGPSSYIMALERGKKPIVVPRLPEFGEHVNNHQKQFGKEYAERYGLIFYLEDVEKIDEVIKEVAGLTVSFESNNKEFNSALESIIEKFFD